MMMAWTLFSFLCQDMLGKITLRIGKYNVSARRDPFPVMLSRGLSWVPPGCCNLVAAWVFFMTLYASIFICYNFMSADPLGSLCSCIVLDRRTQFTLYRVKYVLLSRIQCLCYGGFMIHLVSKRTICFYMFGCKET
jgi:hypothetical protein